MENLPKDVKAKLTRINNALYKGKASKNLAWVKKDHTKIAKWIEESYDKPNSKKAFYNALTVVFRDLFPNEKLRQQYSGVAVANLKNAVEKDEEQELDEKEMQYWKPFPELERMREQWKNSKDWIGHRKYLLLSLYTLTPPLRGDYRNMEIVDAESKAKDKEINFWILKKSPQISWLKINKDKVSNKLGPAMIHVNSELDEVMRESLKQFPRKYVLGKEPMPLPTFNGLLKAVGVRIRSMRSAYVSHFYPALSIAEKKTIAMKMRHDYKTAERSYQKTDKALRKAGISTEPRKQDAPISERSTPLVEEPKEVQTPVATETTPETRIPTKTRTFNRQEYSKRYKERNKEKIKQYMKQYIRNNYQLILRRKLLWELATGNTGKPTQESVEKYHLKKSPEGVWQ
jgi:hypothetical protein